MGVDCVVGKRHWPLYLLCHGWSQLKEGNSCTDAGDISQLTKNDNEWQICNMAIFQDDEAEEGIYGAVVWNKCDAAAGVCMGCNDDIGGDSLGATIKS